MQDMIPAPAANSESPEPNWADVIRLHNLPSMPAVAVRLVQSFADPDTPISKIVGLLESDPALAVKIVHAANTPMYQVGRQVTDLHRAAMLLGRKVVTSLALTFTLSESSLDSGPDQEYFREYWLQSVVQSTAMALLAERYSPPAAGDYQITGLLMDIGRLALLSSTDGAYQAVIDEAKEMDRPLCALETQRLGITHAELSARFLSEWGLPEAYTSAIRVHHDHQSRRRFPDEVVDDRLVAAVQIGSAIGDYFCSTGRGIAWLRLNELMAEHFNADSADVESLVHAVRSRVDESSKLFNTDTRQLCSPLELMSLAMKQLSELALSNVENAGKQRRPDNFEISVDQDRVERVTRASCLDPTVQVYQRSFLEDRFRDAAENAANEDTGIGLILAAVRSRPGSPEPSVESRNTVMKQVVDLLSSSLRPTDIIAREDEQTFAILVTDVTTDDVERLAERLLQRFTVNRIRFPETSIDARIAIGGGVAGMHRGNTADLEDLRSRCRSAIDVTGDTVIVGGNTE